MILIISEELDISTIEVIKWLKYQKKRYFRINNIDKIQILDIRYSVKGLNIFFQVNNSDILNTKDFSSYWYRRGALNYDFSKFNSIELANRELEEIIKGNIKYDVDTIISFLIFIIESNNKIGSIHTAINNKLIHLHIAKSTGMKVPYTEVVTTKKRVEELLNEKKLITKCLSDGVQFSENGNHFALYTKSIDKSKLELLPDNFPPSLIQEKIEKKWEVKIFYLNGKTYSMAIFSQNDKKTEVDFRKYNNSKPNYRVPYNLPSTINKKLNKFMNKVNLNTGSIDMIYDKQGNHIFLEVNPVGQFGMVSYPCNYYLEKQIANFL